MNKKIEGISKNLGEKNINNNYNSYSSLMSPKNITSDWMNERFVEEYFNSVRDLKLLDDEHQIEVFNNWMINITKIMEGDFFITKAPSIR